MPPKQNQGGNQEQNRNRTPFLNAAEDFDLKETSPVLGGRKVFGNDRVGTAYDLVEQMQYMFIRVVKAKELSATKGSDGNQGTNVNPSPFVEIKIGSFKGVTKHFDKSLTPEWNHVFAILNERIQSPVFEVLVRDKDKKGDDVIGMLVFDGIEIPKRVPPDSPLAPQWYRLENKNKDKVKGELMLAIWMGTQADEAFPEACHLDAISISGEGVASIKSKVYLSPRLWYLRVNVIEAQDLQFNNRQFPEIFVRATLGNVVLRTKISLSKNLSPLWNEDLIFVVAEPFEEHLCLFVEDKVGPNKDELLGKCSIPTSLIDKRVDSKPPIGKWYNLEKQNSSETGQKNVVKLNSRVHLRICFDGGYHVLDELTQYSSDLKPSAKQLHKPGIGVLELGILSAQGLSSMKTKDGRGTTDAYCVAKYGQKWIRTRTIVNNLYPKWNEQYTWEVFDPCTVITIGVFDNCHLQEKGTADSRIGKVRIRLSTLATDRVYTHSYPLIILTPSGVKKMGEIQLAVRFSCSSLLNMLQMYTQPLLPSMHYLYPLTLHQIDNLRHQATQIVSARLNRTEPPLRKEVVEYMLDVSSNMWSVRRSKANHFRIASILSGITVFFRGFHKICTWQSPFTTVLAHVLLLCFVAFPRCILSTILLYLFMVGVSRYRSRPRHPPHMDIHLSQADRSSLDDLDEEFDTFPTSRNPDVVRMRYDRLRSIGSRVQTVVGDLATQAERLSSLLSWRDPRATALFLTCCFVGSVLVYAVPFQALVISWGFYVMRHPKFREKLPSLPANFFRRLPARSDSLL